MLKRWPIVLAAIALVGVGTTVVLVRGHDARLPFTTPDAPIADDTGDGGLTVGGFRGVPVDDADLFLMNPSDSPATITAVRLLPGGGSRNLPPDPKIFALGLDRNPSLGGGQGPLGKEYWGVTPAPAVGFEIPDRQADPEQKGVQLLLRTEVGDYSDVSFSGVEVDYEWRGHTYTWHSKYWFLMCVMTKKNKHAEPELPPLCAEDPIKRP